MKGYDLDLAKRGEWELAASAASQDKQLQVPRHKAHRAVPIHAATRVVGIPTGTDRKQLCRPCRKKCHLKKLAGQFLFSQSDMCSQTHIL